MSSDKRCRRPLVSWLTVAVLGLLASGCASHPHFRTLRKDVVLPERSLVFFFVDGLDYTRLHQMLAAGDLPNIRKRFVEDGVQVRHAFTSLPSVTYPNCSTMITGVFPGHHGIMGNFWFDRYTLFARYYMTLDTYRTVNEHFEVPTLYNALHDEFTVNIQNHTRKGVTATIDNKDVFAISWMIGRYSLADHYVGETVDDAVELANEVGRWPRVVMTYYPGVDEVGHRFGSQTPEYGRALEVIDDVVGRVTAELDASAMGPHLYYALVTDHSHVPVRRHMDFVAWVAQNRHVSLRADPVLQPTYLERFQIMDRYDAVVSVDAGRVSMIHLRHPLGWEHRLEPDEVRDWLVSEPSVLDLEAVEMAAIRDGADRVRLLSRAGTALIERRVIDGVKEYRVVEDPDDLLRTGGRPEYAAFVAQGWHASREWMIASAEETYPDLVPQVVEMFDSEHTGDAVIFAAQGWGFAEGPAECGGHGSCLQCDMRVPMMFSGPDLPKGATIDYARVADVMPTVLGLIDEGHRVEKMPWLDGIDLSEHLRQAK